MSRPLTFWGKHRVAASAYDFTICLILYSLFVPALHEAAHWLAAKAYGVDGIIQLGYPLSYFKPATWPTGTGFYVMYFAGGLLVFLAYLLMYSREDEIEEKAGMAPAIVMQLVYGLGEGYWALTGFRSTTYEQILLLSNIAYFAAGLVAVVLLTRYWISLTE